MDERIKEDIKVLRMCCSGRFDDFDRCQKSNLDPDSAGNG